MSGARRRGVRLPGLADSPGNGTSPRSMSPDAALDSQHEHEDDPVSYQSPRGHSLLSTILNLRPHGLFLTYSSATSHVLILLRALQSLNTFTTLRVPH